jgi:methylphosphotriester-DNA--protein-cysteine methyltransferase
MIHHFDLSNAIVHAMIRGRRIVLAGNRRLKIYGHLHCSSGKKMKKENRVFFENEAEAVASGYRRCKRCI